MHVLYLIDSLGVGGAERSLVLLAREYVRRGVRLHVGVFKDVEGLQAELRATGAGLLYLTGAGGRFGNVRRAAAAIRELEPDIVHTTLFEADISGRPAARWAGTPVVSSLVTEGYGPGHADDPRLKWRKVRAAQLVDAATARLARRLHAVSGRVADVMAARLRYPRSRIDVVPRGRDSETLGLRTPERRARVRRALGLADGAIVLMVIARHDFVKGIDVVVSALPSVLQRLPDARLIIVGPPGGQTEALHQQVHDLGVGDSVGFVGRRDDVPDLLCAADVFVSGSRREGLPGTVIESMALEVPIVVTDLPAVREVVDEHTAILVPPEDASAVAAAVVSTLMEREAASARVAHAKRLFKQRFTLDRVVDDMLSFYRRAIAGK